MQQIIKSAQEADSYESQYIRQKHFQIHNQLRVKYIQRYKSQIRKENQCYINLNNLLSQLPSQLEEVLKWCREVIQEFSKSRQYRFPDFKIIQLFKLLEKFPCLQTLHVLYSVTHRISISAIHQLFQYDIIGLLHNLIIIPQKIIPKILLIQHQAMINDILLQTKKKSMLVIASLCQQSEKARNFIVMTHKSFLCLNRVYQKIGELLQNQFLLCLYSFTKHKIVYDEQFVRIVKSLCLLFCKCSERYCPRQVILIIKGLTSAVKCRQKWAMDLLEENCQYDLLEKMLQSIRKCTQNIKLALKDEEKSKDRQAIKQMGQIIHYTNIFLMNYIQVSTNQYFDWENYFIQWFSILEISDSFLQYARRDVYFIFNNIICQAEEPQSGYHLLRSLVFQHNCIHVFSKCLESEINQDVLQELSYCINSLLIHKNVESLAHDIVSSQLVKNILEAITRNFYPVNCNTKQILLIALLKLLERTEGQQLKMVYSSEIKSYQQKLHKISMLYKKQTHLFDNTFDRLLQQCIV